MTPGRIYVLSLIKLAFWIWPIFVYIHTRNLWISIAAMGVEIASGAILLVLWLWTCAAISGLKEKRTQIANRPNALSD
jgi:hypothetical protein